MPKPGGRGGKRSKKGQKRHFTSEDEIRAQQEKEEKEKAWRKQRGIESDESENDEEGDGGGAKSRPARGAPGDLPPSSSEEEYSDEDDEPDKPKGVEHLIDVQNPNRMGAKQSKKISELNEDGAVQLSRREKEELAKQQAAARYRKLHLEGKTEEAQADMARLALIRKQREEAAQRREEEQKAKAAKEAQKRAAKQ